MRVQAGILSEGASIEGPAYHYVLVTELLTTCVHEKPTATDQWMLAGLADRLQVRSAVLVTHILALLI